MSKIFQRNPFLILSIFLVPIVVFFPLIFHYPMTLKNDWVYFNSYNQLVSQLILEWNIFPLRDPWLAGGMDMLTNPEGKLLSPVLPFYILLPPVLTNVLQILIFGSIGTIGFLRLGQKLKWQNRISIIAALIYMSGSWFALHFSEGHIPFVGFLLMPWILYFLMLIQEGTSSGKRLFSLLLFFLMDGQVHAFLLISLFVLIFVLFSGALLNLAKVVFRNWVFYLGLTFVSLAKVIPILSENFSRPHYVEALNMSWSQIYDVFFSTIQNIDMKMKGTDWRFHEFGCYVGFLIPATILIAFLFSKGMRTSRNILLLVVAMFYFWMGSGIGDLWNPWTFLNNIHWLRLHVQSRNFIFFYFLVVILFGYALMEVQTLSRRVGYLLLIPILTISLFVSSSIYGDAFDAYGNLFRTERIRPLESIKTIYSGLKPDIYFSGGQAALNIDESAAPVTAAKSESDPDYRGEIFSDAGGDVRIVSYSPNEITIAQSTLSEGSIFLNTNFLHGWKIEKGQGEIIRTHEGLLSLRTVESHQVVKLKYSPWFLPLVIVLYIGGVFIIIVSTLYEIRKGKQPYR